MQENKINDKDGYSINESFNYLVNLIEKGSNDNLNKEEDDPFISEYFCCKECHDKFINILKKFRDNKIDLTKIDWEKYSSNDSNVIVKLVTYYYNLGLHNSNK